MMDVEDESARGMRLHPSPGPAATHGRWAAL